ncbi:MULTISPECIES: hypothetical protein [unclassified Chamaesiphon]|uniref:hypothetical protein n=1 Tax=unclassified Chamaesiphon TaxID=2620921 RepID=UPI00286D00F5|nr:MULTISPECIES: hypothetical protein [unclassified Chamaesiphon]
MTTGWRRSGSESTDDRLQPETPHYILSVAMREVIAITTGDREYQVLVICDDSARN